MAPDDLYPDMRRPPIDDQTAERLFDGALDPEDAPPGFAPVAALTRAATAPASAGELARRGADVSAVATALHARAAAKTASEGGHMITSRFGTKVLAIAIPVLALTATGAAAAAGALPSPAQTALRGALAHVGISVPTASDTSSSSASDAGTTTGTGTQPPNNAKAVGPDATGPAKYGLCRAYIASDGHPSHNSVAFKNLQQAAGTGGIAAFCAHVTPGAGSSAAGTDGTGTSGGPPASTGTPSNGSDASSSASQKPATPAGPPASTPGSDHAATSTPAGPPTSTPGSDHAATSTPAGPPSSTPAAKP